MDRNEYGTDHLAAAESDVGGIGHLRQNGKRRRHAVGTEEDPGDNDAEESQDERGKVDNLLEARRDLGLKIVSGVIDAEIGAVQRAPDHEGPGGAMPQRPPSSMVIMRLV